MSVRRHALALVRRTVVTGDYPRSSLSDGKLDVGNIPFNSRYRGLSPVFVERQPPQQTYGHRHYSRYRGLSPVFVERLWLWPSQEKSWRRRYRGLSPVFVERTISVLDAAAPGWRRYRGLSPVFVERVLDHLRSQHRSSVVTGDYPRSSLSAVSALPAGESWQVVTGDYPRSSLSDRRHYRCHCW